MGNNMRYYNLTHPQKRIWYIDKINTNSPLHNIGGCLKINEIIDIKIIEKAINILIKINDGLRLRFIEQKGNPLQYIKDFENEDIDFLDFSKYENPKDEHKKWSDEIFKKRFNLDDSKLYYFAIYKLSEKEYGIMLNIHHIISDGWSVALIQNQLCEIYTKLINNEEISEEKNYSYLEFIKEEEEYLKSERFNKNKEFWESKFSDIPEEFLYNTSDNLNGIRQCYDIDSELSGKIKTFADEKKCSLNTFFISILFIYLYKITSKKDIVIGTPVFNRISNSQKNTVGMFTSTVPFRFNLDSEINIESLIKLVNKELRFCLLNQKYPYDLLVEELEIAKRGYDSLFKISVNYYNSKYYDTIDGIDVDIDEYYCGNQSYSLQLIVKEWEENKITLQFDYKIAEYSSEEIKIVYDSMINIINEVLTYDKLSINDINILNSQELDYKMYKFNSTFSNYPKKTIQELFEEQAERTPDNIAVVFKNEHLTYKELNEKSNQLADYLSQNGINTKSIVAIMQTHSIELIISILGVLKAGASYVPIDPSYPKERIDYMLEDSQSSMLLVNFELRDEIQFDGRKICINDEDLQKYNKSNLPKVNNISDLVYIIYTSGSTGKPKGVMIEHRGLTNYIWWANKMYLRDKDEVMVLYSSISFDLTVTSIFTPLISGNTIAVYDNDETEYVLYKILRENKATVVKVTPAHLSLIKDMDNSKSRIKRFIVGGEDLKVSLAKEVSDSFGKDIEIYNEYGPTETVVGCMLYKYEEEKDQGISVPIGSPADNVKIYILDKGLNIVPTGIEGEIYIGGEGVARGYLNKEELTKDKFVDNPFESGTRMYKTGDLAKWTHDGNIEFLGRIDNQVKIRGHRIELGEIERHLLNNDEVKEAVVTFGDSHIGNKVLNAYVVSHIKIEEIILKEWLIKFLPKYMIPTNFIFIDNIPLTLNGKVDYSLLPSPLRSKKEFVKYSTFKEKKLVEIMQDILGVENISMKDNYYELGGDSIKAIQISSKLKNNGLIIKVKDILDSNFIYEISASIEESEDSVIISQDRREGTIERTPIVEWFFNQRFSNENVYNQYVLLEYKAKLDKNKIIIAINKLVESHDALRINYDRTNNKLYYNDKISSEMYNYFDLSQYSYEERSNNIEKIMREINSNIHIENSGLFNIVMIDLDDDRQALLFIAHHLIVDGVSWRIILDDFINIMKQLDEEVEIKLPLKTHSYKEWAEVLQIYSKNDFCEEVDYWSCVQDKHASFNEDCNNGEDTIESSELVTQEIEEEILNILIQRISEIYNIDLNEILIIALVLTLNKSTQKNEIVIEVERHGREPIDECIDVSRTVGWFTSMYPAYFSINYEDIDSNIKSLKEQFKNIPNKGINYSIIKFLNEAFKEQRQKYVRFNYLGDFDSIIDKKKLNISDIKFGLYSDKKNVLTALMDITAAIVNKKLKITVEYSKNRYKDEIVRKFIQDYVEMLKLILDNCSGKDSREFTPSDFDAVNISQEDLDALFI